MKVVIAHSWQPFVTGETGELAQALSGHLTRRGHQAIVVHVPFSALPAERILESVLACRLLSLRGYDEVDRVIALDFPACFIPHDNKVVWLASQFREIYDRCPTAYPELLETSAGRLIRESIHRADREFLPEAKRIYVHSQATGQRLKEWSGIDSEILCPPFYGPASPLRSRHGEHILCFGRVGARNRQALLVDSMRYTGSRVRLVVAGEPETPDDRQRIERAIRDAGLSPRVEFLPDPLPEARRSELLADALACAYLPEERDSCGQAALEACHAGKPMVACADCGDGIGSVIRHGESALVVPPSPEAIAGALDSLYRDRARARRMGQAACGWVKARGTTWDAVVTRLTA
jgi:glycosyltransferase involved in cell wall biosynthesis